MRTRFRIAALTSSDLSGLAIGRPKSLLGRRDSCPSSHGCGASARNERMLGAVCLAIAFKEQDLDQLVASEFIVFQNDQRNLP